MILLTGSRALRYWQGTSYESNSNSSDWDFIASEADLNKIGLSFEGKSAVSYDNNIEFINRDSLNNNKFVGDSNTEASYKVDDKEIFRFVVCTPQELYIQKRSHVWRPIKFMRHISELQKIKELLGSDITSLDHPILKERIKLTKEQFKDRVPSLNKTNEEFFDDFVDKVFDHDSLHRIVAYYAEPIYERLKRNPELAKCERDLWDELSHEDKIRCVQEEAYVIALERFIIPKLVLDKPQMPGRIAFSAAQEKICTTLTSGWFRDFAIDNWWEIRTTQKDFVKDFKEAYNVGRIEKYARKG
jgi:hypothetical protein